MKLSVVGLGRVGRAVAAAAVTRGLVDELVLVGRTPDSGLGEALDLRHASCFSNAAVVRSGGVADTAGSDVVVFAAAVTTALDRVDRTQAALPNAALVQQLIPPLAAASPGAVFVMLTNPIDALTWVALRASGLPDGQVLAPARWSTRSASAPCSRRSAASTPSTCGSTSWGEHGDSQMVALSSAAVGGAPLGVPAERLRALAAEARDAGYAVARAKGYTSHAVALAALMVVEAVQTDSRTVLPVSTRVSDYHGVSDTCLSVPAIVGRGGVRRTLPVQLSDDEVALFRRSADVVKAVGRPDRPRGVAGAHRSSSRPSPARSTTMSVPPPHTPIVARPDLAEDGTSGSRRR